MSRIYEDGHIHNASYTKYTKTFMKDGMFGLAYMEEAIRQLTPLLAVKEERRIVSV